MDFKNITGVLSELSWVKIAQVAVFCLLLMGFITLWVTREAIYQSISVGSIPTTRVFESIYMSNRSIHETKQVMSKLAYTGAIGIQVINVDFKKNIRTQAFFVSNNEKFKQSVENYLSTQGASGTPVFSSIEANNKRIIDLLNGNFICTPYDDTLAPIIYKDTIDIVDHICSIPIPPYYGKFTGYINIYLKEKPTENHVAAIRQSLSELSVIIYEESLMIKPPRQ